MGGSLDYVQLTREIFRKNLVFLILEMFRVMLENRIPNSIICGCDGYYERFHMALITNFYWGKDVILGKRSNVQLFCFHNALNSALYMKPCTIKPY